MRDPGRISGAKRGSGAAFPTTEHDRENFSRLRAKFADVLRLMLAGAEQAEPPALSIRRCPSRALPELELHNSLASARRYAPDESGSQCKYGRGAL